MTIEGRSHDGEGRRQDQACRVLHVVREGVQGQEPDLLLRGRPRDKIYRPEPLIPFFVCFV